MDTALQVAGLLALAVALLALAYFGIAAAIKLRHAWRLNDAIVEQERAHAEAIRSEAYATRLRASFADTTAGGTVTIYDPERGVAIPGKINTLVPQTQHISYPAMPMPQAVAGLPEPASASVTPITAEAALMSLPFNGLMVPFGVDAVTGEKVDIALPKAVHILAAGASGAGKSSFASAMLLGLALRNDENRFNLALLDIEGETAAPFVGLPHTRISADDPETIVAAMDSLRDTMEARYQQYPTQAAFLASGQPFWVIFIEEALSLQTYLAPDQQKEYSAHLTQVAIRGRKRGMFLLYASQVDYSRVDMRAAQGMFLARATGYVKPSAGRSMGFLNTDSLNQLWRDKQPGKFLLEAPGGDRLIYTPTLDIRAGDVARLIDRYGQPLTTSRPIAPSPANSTTATVTAPAAQQVLTETDRALDAYNAGARSVRRLAQALNVSTGKAQGLLQNLREQGLIPRIEVAE